MDDTTLIKRIITQNDDRAITALIRNHQTKIRNFLCRLTAGDHAAAADLTQDTFIIVISKLATFRNESSFSTWIHQVAYRCFLKTLKRKDSSDSEIEVASSNSMEPVDSEILVNQLMGGIKEVERTCLTLFYSAGMTHGEISTVTGMPLGTVKTNIMRGRDNLAKIMKKSDV